MSAIGFRARKFYQRTRRDRDLENVPDTRCYDVRNTAEVAMLVYHFVNAEYGLQNIMKRRLKVATIMELNDPFEFLGVTLADRDFRRALRRTKEKMSEIAGLLCFSATWQNPVQWGHYADKYKGLCLGFEAADELLARVVYISERFPVPAVLDQDFMKRIITTKFSHWSYEQEYRMWVKLDEKTDGLYFRQFSEELKLVSVMVGDQSPVTRAELTDALGDEYKDVKRFKTRPAFRRFEVTQQLDESQWT
jgi:hypothetical protein